MLSVASFLCKKERKKHLLHFSRPQRKGKELKKMALQWMILTYVVAAEAALALLLTLPAPKLLRYRLVSLVSLVLQPALFIVPFSAFQLLGTFSFSPLLYSIAP